MKKEEKIPEIELNMKMYKYWIQETEEHISKQKKMIQIIEQEIKNDERNIKTMKFGLIQAENAMKVLND